MTEEHQLPPIPPEPEGLPVDEATRGYLDSAIAGLETRIQKHIGGLVDERNRKLTEHEGAITKRLTQADFRRMMREYTEWQDRRQAAMLDRVLTAHVGKLRNEVNHMAGVIEGWGTYKDRAVDDLTRRVAKLETAAARIGRGLLKEHSFILELSYDVRGGNPAAPNAPSMAKDLHDLKALLLQQQADTQRLIETMQSQHREEMAALTAKLDAQANVLDMLLAAPRFVVGVIKNWTKGDSK